MKRYYIFLLIVAMAMAVAFVLREGYYPVAFVDSAMLSARSLERQYRAMQKYSGIAAQMYGVSRTVASADLERAALTSLIETALIRAEVRKEVGEDAIAMVNERVDKFNADEGLAKAAEAVYGLNAEEFRDAVLIPQAERDILASRLFLRGKKIDDWLRDSPRAHRVVVFIPGFQLENAGPEGATINNR